MWSFSCQSEWELGGWLTVLTCCSSFLYCGLCSCPCPFQCVGMSSPMPRLTNLWKHLVCVWVCCSEWTVYIKNVWCKLLVSFVSAIFFASSTEHHLQYAYFLLLDTKFFIAKSPINKITNYKDKALFFSMKIYLITASLEQWCVKTMFYVRNIYLQHQYLINHYLYTELWSTPQNIF